MTNHPTKSFFNLLKNFPFKFALFSSDNGDSEQGRDNNSSNNPFSGGSGGSNNNKNMNRKILFNLLTVFLTIGILALILGASSRLEDKTVPKNNFSDLLTEIRQGNVSKIEIGEDNQNLIAQLYKAPTEDNKRAAEQNPDLIKQDPIKYSPEKNRARVETRIYPNIAVGENTSTLESLQIGIGAANPDIKFGTGPGEIIISKREKPWYVQMLENSFWQTILLLAGTMALGFFLIRRLGDINNRSISFGNARSKFYDENAKQQHLTFADVAGNEEAKNELFEVVDFLRRPEEYAKMGAKIPKGVLLVGGPGNGKTLMAKAVAGEAKVPFIYVSGSEFVEMFVGVGASRVRDLFRQAKKKAPCLIFIDEIDAVGRQRGAGLGGGNDEREQTLNQILVEMDGFEPTDCVILIGATNRPDVLDPALLRPGRFDRQVTVTMPDKKEREAILKIHAANKKISPQLDMGVIAKRTAGFSGADLMNVLNEAAILAVREKSDMILDIHAREAIEKVLLGPSLNSKVITEDQKKLTAYHEAGHALIQTIIPECRKVQKVTIIPRGRAAGYTFADEGENDPITRKRSEFLADITSLFGGYVAEELIFGEVSTGGSNDLQKATEMARGMVTKYGMSALGPISFEEGKGMSFLGRDMMENRTYSEDSAKRIDMEVAHILKDTYENCKQIMQKYIEDLHRIAQALIDKEVIEYEEFSALVGHLLPAKKPVSVKN